MHGISNTFLHTVHWKIYKLKFPDKRRRLALSNISSKLPHMEIDFERICGFQMGVWIIDKTFVYVVNGLKPSCVNKTHSWSNNDKCKRVRCINCIFNSNLNQRGPLNASISPYEIHIANDMHIKNKFVSKCILDNQLKY